MDKRDRKPVQGGCNLKKFKITKVTAYEHDSRRSGNLLGAQKVFEAFDAYKLADVMGVEILDMTPFGSDSAPVAVTRTKNFESILEITLRKCDLKVPQSNRPVNPIQACSKRPQSRPYPNRRIERQAPERVVGGR